MSAPRLLLACITAVALAPVTVTAQHGKEASHAPTKEVAAEHATGASKHDETPATSAAKDGHKTTEPKGAAHEAAHKDEPPAKADTAGKKPAATAKDDGHGEHAPSTEHGEKHAASDKPAAAHGEEASGHKGKATASSRTKAPAQKNELAAALKRIDDQIAVMRAPKPERAPAPRRGVDTRAARTAHATPATQVPPRVRLSWRTTLLWTNELDGDGAAAEPAPHVALVWAPEPIAARPVPALAR